MADLYIDEDVRRACEVLRELRRSVPNETRDQQNARSSLSFALKKKLVDVSREVARDAVARCLPEPNDDAPEPIAQRRADAKTERRAFAAEVRAKGRRLEGYAATFGAEAKIGNFIETIAPGAFAASLAERADILALVDHDPGRVLARTRSKTLRLAEDSRGLAFDLDLPATTAGNDVLALAERGDLGGMSFAFTIKNEQWDKERRTLEAVDLHEVSVVSAWPAYDGTIVQARAQIRGGAAQLDAPRVAIARRYLETL